MTTLLTSLAAFLVLLGPFALIAALAGRAHRPDGTSYLRLHFDQFRFAAPLVGPLFEDRR